MNNVTAQAFREAAHKEAERAELSSRLGRQQLYFHESPLNVIQRENAMLLLAAAEQREQLDSLKDDREALQRHFDIHVQQASENIDDFLTKIEELTAERDSYRAKWLSYKETLEKLVGVKVNE